MKHSKKRRRRPQQPQKQAGENSNGDVENSNGGEMERERIINSLVEAFSLASVEEAKAAYDEANGDANKAAEILGGLPPGSDNSEIFSGMSYNSSEVFRSSCSSSTQSSGLDSSSSDGFNDLNGAATDDLNGRGFRGNRGKKVVAATGTVSTVLGKDYYVWPSPKKEVSKQKGMYGNKVDIEEAEQFLCSMLGDDCDLGMGVVRDVFSSCGYDVEKASEVLLGLSVASCEQSRNDEYSGYNASNAKDTKTTGFIDDFCQLTEKGYDSTCRHPSESEVQGSLLNMTCRNYAEALVSSQSSRKLAAANLKTEGQELPQQVLESLFNIPKSSEHEPATMNWRNVVKQMESFAQKRVELCPPGNAAPLLDNLEKGAEYQVFRESAREQWDKMKTCYQKAAAAYAGGEKNYASYMSDKGKLYSKMAREADEKASMEIFKARNKDIENVLTIDLHGQHVKPAMRLVKLHLLFGTYISSVQYLRIITGCGSHGVGKSKLKQSVINLLEKEGIEWREENRGTMLIKLDGAREFSFLDSGSDSDSG